VGVRQQGNPDEIFREEGEKEEVKKRRPSFTFYVKVSACEGARDRSKGRCIIKPRNIHIKKTGGGGKGEGSERGVPKRELFRTIQQDRSNELGKVKAQREYKNDKRSYIQNRRGNRLIFDWTRGQKREKEGQGRTPRGGSMRVPGLYMPKVRKCKTSMKKREKRESRALRAETLMHQGVFYKDASQEKRGKKREKINVYTTGRGIFKKSQGSGGEGGKSRDGKILGWDLLSESSPLKGGKKWALRTVKVGVLGAFGGEKKSSLEK